ncbi:MAG: hypothetical protein OHK0056_28670 [Bacteriovoracaceae bacterium]
MLRPFSVFVLSLLLSISAFADYEREVEDLCKRSGEFFNAPFGLSDILLKLYAKFDQKDERGRNLKFSADNVLIEDHEVVFENPRINGRVIKDIETWCSKSKKNFLGYEVCQEISSRDISHSLCKQLGHEDSATKEGEITFSRAISSRDAFLYMFADGEWNHLRIGSMLAPSVSYTKLSKLRCKLKNPN